MRAWLLVVLVGCAGNNNGTMSDAHPSNDGPVGCGITLTFDPADPIASPTVPIRVFTNIVNSSGVVTYTWSVRDTNFASVPFTSQASDDSQINFVAPNPGPYYVDVSIGNSPIGCSYASGTVNVSAPNANTAVYRLRTVAGSLAPPQESIIQVKGGADMARSIALDTGLVSPGSVIDNLGSGIQAYLKFMPVATPAAYTELFSSTSGGYSVRLLGVNHDVLVVPAVAGLAPKLIGWTVTTTTLQVGPGTTVTGTVHAPNTTGLGGAKVQLYAGIVPSTIATTAADGTFSLHADFPAGAMVTVKVTPPATSGLPRLDATAAFSIGTPFSINYSPSLATCDLANVPVRRGGSALPGAKVFVVGASSGGLITAGVGISATGTVHVVATADGAGKLPSTLVPRATLSAVTEVSMTDHAVSALDTSACSVAQVDAPAMINVSGTARSIDNTPLDGVRVEASSLTTLSLAGILPVQATSAANGSFNLLVASGGRYDVRFTDPKARGAPLVVLDVTSAGIPSNAVLPKALTISGDVSVLSSTNPVIGASVQVLCATCTGLDAARPIAETATDALSKYRIAVPDPGTL